MAVAAAGGAEWPPGRLDEASAGFGREMRQLVNSEFKGLPFASAIQRLFVNGAKERLAQLGCVSGGDDGVVQVETFAHCPRFFGVRNRSIGSRNDRHLDSLLFEELLVARTH